MASFEIPEGFTAAPPGPIAEPDEFPHLHGPWKILARQRIHSDPWMEVLHDQVERPDGQAGTYSVVRIKRGVSVLAIDDEDRVYLTREFHYAVGRETLEVISGGIDPGESPLAAAQRELREEAGLIAANWQTLGWVDPFTASIDSPTMLLVATGLSQTSQELEGCETLQIELMPLQAAVTAVLDSKITHAPSCVAILKYALKRMNEQTPKR